MLPYSFLEADENSRAVRSKILVADDNSDVRRLLALHLQQSSYDTVEAATGREAIQQARATHPDLMLMDLAMPGGNGDEAIAALKADPLTQDIPTPLSYSQPFFTVRSLIVRSPPVPPKSFISPSI